MPLEVLLGKPPKMHREVATCSAPILPPLNLTDVRLQDAVIQVLSHPTVASKRFLVTIGDRTVGGLSHRDPMVGPWQVPVADCAITLADFVGYAGEAMSMGERTPIAALNPAASGRMAVAEAITNLAWLHLFRWTKSSCLPTGWPLAARWVKTRPLYDTVKAVGLELCPALGISIPVGKDSLSMRTRWSEAGQAQRQVTSPVSLIVTAFVALDDVSVATSTPQLDATQFGQQLGLDRFGQAVKSAWVPACLAQILDQAGGDTPDLGRPARLAASWSHAINDLRQQGLLLGLPRQKRWRFVGHGLRNGFCRPSVGVDLNIDLLVTEGDGVSDSRADHGDSKNWAQQVGCPTRRTHSCKRCSTKNWVWWFK
jgi:phosphoribosylformylglycinamidine synthase